MSYDTVYFHEEDSPNNTSKIDYNLWSSYQFSRKPINISSKSKLFIYSLIHNEKIELDIIPDQLAESYSQKILKVAPFGVIHPYNMYTGGNGKTLQMTINLYEDISYCKDDGSLYGLLNKIKRLSESSIVNFTVQQPIVYFQLGSQFAGQGHLSSTLVYKKPLSRIGSYKFATVTLNFTFHEIYNSDNIQTYHYDNTDIIESDNLGISLEGTRWYDSSKSESEMIEDFYTKNVSYDYIVSTVFEQKKLGGLLSEMTGSNIDFENSAIGSIIRGDTSSSYSTKEEYEKAVYDALSSEFTNTNAFYETIIELYMDFFVVINTMWVSSGEAKINNLNKLLKNIEILQHLNWRFIDKKGTDKDMYQITDFIESLNQLYHVKLKPSEKNFALKSLEGLKVIVIAQLRVYEFLIGAGS